MEHVTDDFSSLSLKDVAGNRIEFLSKIQEQIHAAISTLNTGSDLLSIKKGVECILQQVNKNLDVIKASCSEEGIILHVKR